MVTAVGTMYTIDAHLEKNWILEEWRRIGRHENTSDISG
jgi:hypothetical protein